VSGEARARSNLVTLAVAGDRRALAQALTLLERGTPEISEAMAGAIASSPAPARRIGFTGPPGAGKSTLIAEVAARFRARQLKVGILAVDPSSAFTGGAVLGDRVRMSALAGDPGVFVRSFAARGQPGGLAEAISEAADLLALAGYERVLIETIGVGQGDVGVAGIAQTVVVVFVPEAGDAVQSLKAGLIEIGDVLVVNKADRPGAEAFAAEIGAALALGATSAPAPPVLLTSTTSGAGLDELHLAIEQHGEPSAVGDRRRRAIRAHLLSLLAAQMERSFAGDERLELERAVDEVAAGRRPPRRAAVELWARLRSRS
jgi:LAO/AO transport system kinase